MVTGLFACASDDAFCPALQMQVLVPEFEGDPRSEALAWLKVAAGWSPMRIALSSDLDHALVSALRSGTVNPDLYPHEIRPNANITNDGDGSGGGDGGGDGDDSGGSRTSARKQAVTGRIVGKHALLTSIAAREARPRTKGRISHYERGQALASSLMLGWTTTTHKWHHADFRTAVTTMFLISVRLDRLWSESLLLPAATHNGSDSNDGDDGNGGNDSNVVEGSEETVLVLPPELWRYILRFLTRSDWPANPFKRWKARQELFRALHP